MDLIIYFCICICVVMIFTFYIGRIVKQGKNLDTEKGTTAGNVEEIKTEFETVKVQAEVIDLSCRVDMVGIKTSRSVTFFTVTFETDDKEIIRVDVPQEMYGGLEVGQIGEVTLVEGELYSFIV